MESLIPTSSQNTFLKSASASLWNQCFYFFFKKHFSPEQIEHAINSILENSDALRMKFHESRVQIADYRYVKMLQIHINDERELEDFLKAEIKKDFTQSDYLLKMFVIISGDDTGFACVIHHILADGYSVDCVVKRITAVLEGKPAPNDSFIPQLISEAKYRASQKFLQDIAFWDKRLDDLPTMNCFDPINNEVKHFDEEFPDSVTEMLDSFCRDYYVTETSVLFSALAIYLHRVSGAERFTIGMPVINRTTTKELQAIGLYMHIIPLIAEVHDEDNFTSVLNQVQSEIFFAFRHPEFTSYDIQKNCLQGKLAYSEIFDVTVEYTAHDTGNVSEPCVLYGDQMTSSLEVHFFRQGTQLRLVARYRTGASILRFFEVLENCLSKPDNDISSLLDSAFISNDFMSGQDVSLPRSSLYQLAEAQGAGQIIEGSQIYSLSTLLHDAEKIDAAIHGRKRVIGIICDRSYLEIAAIYGIIRGGNAYLPISPDYPIERIRLMINQSKCDTVLVQKKYSGLISGFVIEDILQTGLPAIIPPVEALPEDSLYVIFTSGSTGSPKGSVVSNRSAVNRVLWMCHKYFDHDTVVMRKTPYTFDVSVWEIFGFALRGFTLYILPENDHYRQKCVIEHIRKGKVTDLHFVPTVFSIFLDALKKDGGALPSLKGIFLSGEVLSAYLVNRSPAPVRNLYGPTECAVDVTSYDCDVSESDPVPIGLPIDNCRIYVMDRYLKPLPPGVTGQICIGGTPVGLGYINDPEKTAFSFVFATSVDSKIYLTGDLGYFREDGQLIYVGRKDQQVKINGQRIELGEIEAVLSAFVTSCAVVFDNQRIIAFYTGDERDDLNEELRGILPRYMVPHSFIHMNELPVLQNGKIDRAALLNIRRNNDGFAAPADALEESICSIFSQVLKIENVSRNDNFFDLGGTSLNMMELLSIEPLCSLSADLFFQNPMPAGLANIIRNGYSISCVSALYLPDKASYAYVLFSYAGGGASAYTALVSEFRKRKINTALFFVPWDTDYNSTAEEIENLSKQFDIAFYSHCAGSVVALKLLDQLNKEKRIVKKLIVGANIPPVSFVNPWHITPNKKILSLLHKAGLPMLSDTDNIALINRFRNNTDEYFDYFSSAKKVTPVTISIIVSRHDPFTQNYSKSSRIWRRHVEQVANVHYLDCSTHYFQTDCSDELTDILTEET